MLLDVIASYKGYFVQSDVILNDNVLQMETHLADEWFSIIFTTSFQPGWGLGW